MSLMRHVTDCNRADLADFHPFHVDGRRLGWVRSRVARRLADFPGVFQVDRQAVTLAETLTTPEARTAAVAEVLPRLVEDGLIGALRGEPYRVTTAWAAPDAFTLDRAAASLFGVLSFGVHLNGWRRLDDGRLALWIAQRNPAKAVAPGKLDNLAAGGQPAGLSLRENMLKEVAEEASLGPEVAQAMIPTGAIAYRMATGHGLRRDVLFTFDLEVPADVTPTPGDDEVAGFHLMEAEQVLCRIRESDDFKFNVNLVIAHFALRHGLLSPDNEPDYQALAHGLAGPADL
ncbi:DUF4743 domain-containing protein [Roseospirillum parvum]|uniref:Nudix hydrolase domain-containing protein n=1 Tax=Roseospirillum parvum TaxID=83401 RepID=A0A1G7UDL2_9PROT|nr:DUF4743 domain-containing protein [Roseospirillum parvum]SDG45564.1 protein of unknown function [Roseospirillum parvum]